LKADPYTGSIPADVKRELTRSGAGETISFLLSTFANFLEGLVSIKGDELLEAFPSQSCPQVGHFDDMGDPQAPQNKSSEEIFSPHFEQNECMINHLFPGFLPVPVVVSCVVFAFCPETGCGISHFNFVLQT
jgi:hypothetical protein